MTERFLILRATGRDDATLADFLRRLAFEIEQGIVSGGGLDGDGVGYRFIIRERKEDERERDFVKIL